MSENVGEKGECHRMSRRKVNVKECRRERRMSKNVGEKGECQRMSERKENEELEV